MSLLLAKDESMKTINCRVFRSSLTYLNSLVLLSNCHCRRLFNEVISSVVNFVDWAACDKSNAASDWQMDAM